MKRKIHPLIAITGLDNAGKTTFIHRLKTGEFNPDFKPTIGYDFSLIKKDDFRFDIVDLGGHEFLRKQFWLNYASNIYGILFIFDASDKERIYEGKEWFWYLIKNLEIENKIAVSFLANKADLECISLDEIIQTLELKNMSKYPKISFQIFRISVKTNLNVNEAMN